MYLYMDMYVAMQVLYYESLYRYVAMQVLYCVSLYRYVYS